MFTKFALQKVKISTKCEYFLEHKQEGAVVPERRLGDMWKITRHTGVS